MSDGYSHHDYEESGIYIENCTITNCTSIINGVEQDAVPEHHYVK